MLIGSSSGVQLEEAGAKVDVTSLGSAKHIKS